MLGLPVVPPAGLAAAGIRARYRLRRASEAGPPFLVVLERLMAIYDNRVLGLLCQLRVPEALATGPATAAELAPRLSTPDGTPVEADALHRVLRYAAVRGLVARDRSGRFGPNAITDVLRADHPSSMRPWVEFLAADWLWRVFTHADRAMVGEDPSRAAHGHDFFSYVNEQNPEAGVAFNGAMAAGSWRQGVVFAQTIDLAGVTHLVDVGGGTGTIAGLLLERHEQLRVTVVELAAVADAGRVAVAGEPWADRCSFEAGDFFTALPPGADVYTLFAVAHDWGDDDVVRILTSVRTAMSPASRCLLVDADLDDQHPDAFAAGTDLLMLLITAGGRERTDADWRRLANAAGLELAESIPLASGFAVHDLRRR